MTDIPQQVILDANIVLNAAFLNGGQCDNAVKILDAKGATFLLDEITWNECTRRLGRILVSEQATLLALDPLVERMARLKVLHVPPAPLLQAEPRHDAHIIGLATEWHVPVLTTDNELQARLLRRGLEVLMPDAQEFWERPFWGPPPVWLNQAHDQATQELLVMFWALPGAWAGTSSVSRHALFSADQWGCLSFENGKKPSVRFDAPQGAPLVCRHRLHPGRTLIAAITTRFNPLDIKSSKSAVFASSGRSNRDSHHSTDRIVPTLPTTRRWLGSDGGRSSFWNGHIQSIRMLPKWLSPRVWKLVTELPDFRPSFSVDVGRLEGAVREMFGAIHGAR